jgi:Tfp pilus assembly protein PilX
MNEHSNEPWWQPEGVGAWKRSSERFETTRSTEEEGRKAVSSEHVISVGG